MSLSRRDLLVGATAASTLPYLSGLAPAQSSGKKIGWAILGLGGYATRQILPNIDKCEHSKLTAVISGSKEKATRFALEYKLGAEKAYTYDDWEKIKNDPEIDVVYVITPPGTHRDFTLQALEAGKHVCCEKPMASSAKECKEMVDAAKKAGKLLQIGYRCHFEPNNLKAMELCRTGKLGTIRTIRSEHGFTMNSDRGWHSDKKLGGFGAISEIGVYAIQALCYLAGADPIEIIGTREKLDVARFKHVEDVNHFNFLFPGGIQGIGSTAYTWNANNYRVYGQYGNITAEPATGYTGHRFSLNGQEIQVEAANQWARQMDDLSLAILNPSHKLKTPGEMGYRDIRIIEAIIKSADSKSTVKFV